MSDDPHERQAWTNEELDLIVSDYFLMLTEETAGAPFNKAEHNRILRNEIVRSKSSIEFKHRNISAVLQQLGLKLERQKSATDQYKIERAAMPTDN